MTEADWFDKLYLLALFRHVDRDDDVTYRKFRLFGTACCRRALEYLPDPVLGDAVEVCERWAHDPFAPAVRAAERHVRALKADLDRDPDCWHVDLWHLAWAVSALSCPYLRAGEAEVIKSCCMDALCGHDDFFAGRGEILFQRDFLHDVFGNPFRPVAFDPGWRTEPVVALAGQMYDARDFGPMPVLADALEDAGCEHADILAHCRDPEQVHVRGCWVVDLVLGKA